MVSHVEEEGMVDRGQASPSGVESIWVRDGGQIGDSPSIKTCHSVGRETTGTEDAWVVGWEMK
jgi:hypothetical protein